MDPDRRATYDALAGFSASSINPFADVSMPADQVGSDNRYRQQQQRGVRSRPSSRSILALQLCCCKLVGLAGLLAIKHLIGAG